MQLAKYEEIAWVVSAGTRGGGNKTSEQLAKGEEGFKYKRLFTGRVGEPGNFEMVVLRTEAAANLRHFPRHRHAFEQVRLTLAGKPDWTPGSVTPEGWVIYVGAGTYYGPYDRQGGHEQLHIQFQGAGCPPFLNYEEMTVARDALTKKGSFEKGVFTWIDERGQRHNKDGHAATVEQATGMPLVMPAPRISEPVNMNPDACAWVEVAPGVQRKELGSFTEAETRMSFLRLEPGVRYDIPRARQRMLFFVCAGTGSVNGQAIAERDGIMLDEGESGVRLENLAKDASNRATTELQLFVMDLPRLALMQAAREASLV